MRALDGYTKPAPRAWEQIAGLVMGVFGVGILALAAYAIYFDLVSAGAFQWGFVTVACVGASCLPVAWRLLMNRPRQRDQGLFGPGFLCIGGAIFLFGGAVKAVSDFPIGLLFMLPAGAWAYVCFALARKRVRQSDRGHIDHRSVDAV